MVFTAEAEQQEASDCMGSGRTGVADPCNALRFMSLTEHALHSVVPRCPSSFLTELAWMQRGLSAQLYTKAAVCLPDRRAATFAVVGVHLNQ